MSGRPSENTDGALNTLMRSMAMTLAGMHHGSMSSPSSSAPGRLFPLRVA